MLCYCCFKGRFFLSLRMKCNTTVVNFIHVIFCFINWCLFGIWCQQHVSNKFGQQWHKTGEAHTCLEHSTGKQVHLVTGDSLMIGYERGVLERLSRSQASMEWVLNTWLYVRILLHGLGHTVSVNTIPFHYLILFLFMFTQHPDF